MWLGPRNADRIMAALDDFGFGALGLKAEDFEHPGRVVQLGYPPYRIDILTGIDGVEFDAAWERRITVAIGDADVPFIRRTDLVANKRAANRPQDRADVVRLTRDDPPDQ